MKTNLYLFFVLLFVGLASFWQGCEYGKRHELRISYDTITTTKDTLVFDTNVYEIPKHIPMLVYDTLQIPPHIDTAQSITDYYTRKYVTDSIHDSRLALYIADTLYQNTITHRTIDYKILRPDTIRIIEKTFEEKNFLKTRFLVNIGATYTTDNKILPGIQLNYNKWGAAYHSNLQGQNQFNLYYNLWKH